MQHGTGVRRLLQEVIFYPSTAPSAWSTGDDAGITIPLAYAPALLPMSSGQTQSSDENSSFDTVNHFSPSVAIIMVALLSAFFFMGFFSIYVRRCADNPSIPSNTHGSLRRANELNEEHQQQGLDPDFLHRLPLVAYSSAKKKGSNVECVVCLTDFEEHEPLRQLPACKHVFHQDCIDMWLFSHSTCPLCRRCIAVPTSGSMSLRWGGSGSFRQISFLGGRGGSNRQQSNAMQDAGMASLMERGRNNSSLTSMYSLSVEMNDAIGGHGNSSAETNVNINIPPLLAESTSVNRATHSMDLRQQQAAHLTRCNTTGHSLQLGPANAANAESGVGRSLSMMSGLHRSSSAMAEQHGNNAE